MTSGPSVPLKASSCGVSSKNYVGQGGRGQDHGQQQGQRDEDQDTGMPASARVR